MEPNYERFCVVNSFNSITKYFLLIWHWGNNATSETHPPSKESPQERVPGGTEKEKQWNLNVVKAIHAGMYLS